MQGSLLLGWSANPPGFLLLRGRLWMLSAQICLGNEIDLAARGRAEGFSVFCSGAAAESSSAVASPPVAEVRAPEPEEGAEPFADALSLECVQKESSLAGKPLDKTHVTHPPVTPAHQALEGVGDPSAFKEALGLEELPHRRQPGSTSPMTTGRQQC